MKQFTITISDEEGKALLTDMGSIQEWIDNAIHNKARQVIDKVCEEALLTPGALTKSDISQIRVMMDERAIPPVMPVKRLPGTIKLEIVKRANIKSAAEKQAEEEAKMAAEEATRQAEVAKKK